MESGRTSVADRAQRQLMRPLDIGLTQRAVPASQKGRQCSGNASLPLSSGTNINADDFAFRLVDWSSKYLTCWFVRLLLGWML